MDIKVDDYFEFCGLSYKAMEVAHDPMTPFDKCKLCDLNKDGRKLCLSNTCNCGSCAGFARRDGKDIIFTLDETANSDVFRKLIALRKELANMDALIHENRILKERNRALAKKNLELVEQNKKFKEQLKTIYANINRAIKAEVYKHMNK